eukprot:GCRY01002480.1.p1 GENE.GCRY01002480.1~~GCRY01002480.1.p1  ORF type:complete len:119 (-),score=17.73 GCRY01002480.1:168-524(-)
MATYVEYGDDDSAQQNVLGIAMGSTDLAEETQRKKEKRRENCAVFWLGVFFTCLILFIVGMSLKWRTVPSKQDSDEEQAESYSLLVAVVVLCLFGLGILISTLLACRKPSNPHARMSV